MRPFAAESPTKRRGRDLSTYQALLSVFDEMKDEERLDFVELAFHFKNLAREEQKRLIRELSGTWPAI